MQSQVASGVLPLAPFLLSSLQEDYPSPSLPSPSLVFFFRLLCLSVSSSLSHLWPFILPQPSLPSLFFSWYFSSLLREGFLVEVSPSWQQGRQMYSTQTEITQMYNSGVLSRGTMAYWIFLWLNLCFSNIYFMRPLTLSAKCAFETIVLYDKTDYHWWRT